VRCPHAHGQCGIRRACDITGLAFFPAARSAVSGRSVNCRLLASRQGRQGSRQGPGCPFNGKTTPQYRLGGARPFSDRQGSVEHRQGCGGLSLGSDKSPDKGPCAAFRMAMSLSILGLRVPGVKVADPDCVANTYPGFFDDLNRLRSEARAQQLGIRARLGAPAPVRAPVVTPTTHRIGASTTPSVREPAGTNGRYPAPPATTEARRGGALPSAAAEARRGVLRSPGSALRFAGESARGRCAVRLGALRK